MGLDMRPDRLNPVTPGIPGAIRQPQLGRESVALRSIGRRAFSRPKRRAARALSCQVLSGLLADSMTLYGEYKRFDFLPADEAPFGLQGFIDRQASEQLELMDLIVERVGLLGGVAPVPREVAGLTAISRSPMGSRSLPWSSRYWWRRSGSSWRESVQPLRRWRLPAQTSPLSAC